MAADGASVVPAAGGGGGAGGGKKKPLFDEYELAVSCIFGGFFTALAVADVSVDVFADGDQATNGVVRGHYLRWKHEAPIIGTMMLVMALPLPVVFFMLVSQEVLPLFGNMLTDAERAFRSFGAATLALIITVVTIVITQVMPAENECKNGGDEVCAGLYARHMVVLAINVVLLVIPFLRYRAARAMDAAPKSR